MAKVAAKRKADASPVAAPRRSKLSKTATMKKKDADAADGGLDDDIDELSQEHGSESSGMFVGQTPPGKHQKQVQNVRVPKPARVAATKKAGAQKHGKNKKVVRVASTVADDEEEDFGRTESQQFLEMVRMGSKNKKGAKKSNEYLESFKKVVKEEQDGLESLLEQKANEITKQNDSFLAAFESAYSSAMLMLAPSQGPESSGKANASRVEPHNKVNKENRLKKHSESVLKDASELIDEYEQCEDLIKTLGKKVAVGEKWNDGVDKAKRILEGGRLVGEKKVESVMLSAEEAERDQFVGRETESREGEALYERETEPGGWAEVAKQQGKVVRKMVRLLPVD